MRRLLWSHTSAAVLALLVTAAVSSSTSSACDVAPAADCPTAPHRKAQLFLDNHLKPVFLDSRVIWRWARFPALTADFGSPDTTTSFELCIYDSQDGVPGLRYRFAVPPGGQCGKQPCWKRTPTGWKYRNSTGAPDGIVVVQFDGNDAGHGELAIRGSGQHLVPFGLPLAKGPEVVAQLNTSDGRCWSTHFARALRNNRGQFMAKSD
jgi:hypothetical protein